MTRRLYALALAGVTLTLAACSDSITAPLAEAPDVVAPPSITVDPCAAFAMPDRLPELPGGCDDPNEEPAVR